MGRCHHPPAKQGQENFGRLLPPLPRRSQHVAYSIGIYLRDDGTIADTIEGMSAAKAGIGPGMRLIGVNGRKYSAEVLHDALKAGKSGTAPLELLVENTDYYKTYKIDYHGGERYPHLVR